MKRSSPEKTAKKGSGRFSLNALMHNQRFLVILSILLAIAVWGSVMSSSGTVRDRSITLSVPIDLTNSYASQIGLRLVEDVTADVTVVVEGPWTVIANLTQDDLRVRADLSTLQRSGEQEISLSVSRNSAVVDYDIVSYYPATVTVNCDYWESHDFTVETDISLLSVTDPDVMQLGTPVLDSSVASGVTLSGPKSEISRIKRLVATVQEADTLNDVTTYTVPLIAYDEGGEEVDLSHCSFDQLTSASVSMTVPVNYQTTIPLSYTLTNVPAAYRDSSNVITLSEQEITLSGPLETLANLSSVGDLGTLDFDTFRPGSNGKCTVKRTLDIPEGVTIVQGDADVTITVLGDLTTKQLTFRPTSSNTTYSGLSSAQSATLSRTSYTVTLVGTASALASITASDLSATVTLDSLTTGSSGGTMRFAVNSSNSVWVYYGSNGGVSVTATISNS